MTDVTQLHLLYLNSFPILPLLELFTQRDVHKMDFNPKMQLEI